jgi:hypothetical protein
MPSKKKPTSTIPSASSPSTTGHLSRASLPKEWSGLRLNRLDLFTHPSKPLLTEIPVPDLAKYYNGTIPTIFILPASGSSVIEMMDFHERLTRDPKSIPESEQNRVLLSTVQRRVCDETGALVFQTESDLLSIPIEISLSLLRAIVRYSNEVRTDAGEGSGEAVSGDGSIASPEKSEG